MSQNILDPLVFVLWGFFSSKPWERTANIFFYTGRKDFFRQKLCFQRTLKCYRNDLLISTIAVKNPCGACETGLRSSSYSILRDTIRRILIFSGKLSILFENLCFQRPLSCYRNDNIIWNKKCQISLLNLKISTLGFVTFDNTRKNRPNIFFPLENSIFLQNYVF